MAADRAGRFFDQDVDIGLTRPGNDHDQVPDQGLEDGIVQLVGFLEQARSAEVGDCRFGRRTGILPMLVVLVGPGLREDPRAGPLEGFEVAQPLGQFQSQHIAFGTRRLEQGSLTVKLEGALGTAVALQVAGDVHHASCADLLHIQRRHDGAFNFLLAATIGLQGKAQQLIHPGLALTVTQGRVDQRDDVFELLLLKQLPGGLVDRGGRLLMRGEVVVPENFNIGIGLEIELDTVGLVGLCRQLARLPRDNQSNQRNKPCNPQ